MPSRLALSLRLALLASCLEGVGLASRSADAQDRYTVSTELNQTADAVAIVPDPTAATPVDGTPGSVKLPPLPKAPPAVAPARAQAPVQSVGAQQPAASAGPAVAPSQPPLDEIAAAPVRQTPVASTPVEPAPLKRLPEQQAPVLRAPVRSTRAAAAKNAPTASYIIHRDGRLWLVKHQGETATARAAVDFGTIRLAPAVASAARAGLVTLFVDAHPVGSRLVVTALAGSVPDRAAPEVTRWAWRR